MSTALALRLIASGAVSAVDAEAALLSSLARRVPFVRALIDTGAISEAALEQTLEQIGGIGLRQVAGMPELVNRLPPHFCRRMGILPVRVDPTARVVEIAAADPLDPHIAAEIGFHLGVPARVLRAPMSAIEEAIRRIELEAEAAAGRARRATPPFPHGAPESSNPPPPPPEPAPIPLLRRATDRSPDTLRLYKQTLRPSSLRDSARDGLSDSRPDLEFEGELPPGSDPMPLTQTKTLTPPDLDRHEAPRTLRDSARLREIAETAEKGVRESRTDLREMGRQISGEAPRSSRSRPNLKELADQLQNDPIRSPMESRPNLKELADQLQNEPIPRTLRDSTRLRDLAQQASRDPARALRDSTPRLRDMVEPPPPVDRLRDSTPRLRDLAAGLPATEDAAPLSSMVAADQAPAPGEPPAVSFPSLPPPSVLEQPGLLAADADLSPPPPAAEPRPEAPPAKQRRPSRFARPAIDIQLPQPPSENRARRQRTVWDVSMAGSEVRDDESPRPVEAEVDVARAPIAASASADASPYGPPSQSAARPDLLDTSAVLDALRGAASRDDVVVAALRGLRAVGRRAAIFVVRRDGFHGWSCNVEMGEQDKLRAVSIPHDAPSLFATAVATGSYFGPVPGNAVHAKLLDLLEHSASDVAVAVARAGGKPVMLLFADDLVDAKRRVLPRLIELADAVGASLSRLLAARL